MYRKKSMAAGILVISIVTGSTLTGAVTANAAEAASEKEEVVYVMTDANGKVNSVNVVNIFGKGNVTDYGNYSSVKMLTSTAPITQENDKITFSNEDEKVYYQGTLDNAQIPWNINITYTLDGKEITPEELAGKSGKLKIHVSITENTKCDSSFYENYALQAAFTLDTTQCENIVADGATLANVGSQKQISYTVLPGKGLEADITADVTDFEMAAAAINGVKLNLNIDIDDEELMDKVAEIQDATADLNDGATELKDGASELKDGAGEVKNGAAELKDGAANVKNGAAEVKDGTGKLASGSDSLKAGASSLYDGINSLNGGIESLNSGINTISDGLNQLQSKSQTLTGGSAQILSALQTIQASLSNVSVSTEQLKTLTDSSAAIKTGINDLYDGAVALQASVSYDSYKAAMSQNGLDIDALQAANAQTIDSLNTQIGTLQTSLDALQQQIEAAAAQGADTTALQQQAAMLSAQLQSYGDIVKLLSGNSAAIGGTQTYLNAVSEGAQSLVTGLAQLKANYEQFDAAIGELANTLTGLAVNMNTLKGGIDELVTQYSALDAGINDYTNGVATIVAGYTQLTDGAATLTSGSKELLNGSNTLKQGTVNLYDGIQSLYSGTSALSDGTSALYNGTVELSDGTVSLYDGTVSLSDGTVSLSDGTAEFYDKTYDMDTQVQDQIDEMLNSLSGSDEDTVSFVSDKNTNVESVQFVIKTEAVEKEEAVSESTEETTQTGFFEKLKALFVK